MTPEGEAIIRYTLRNDSGAEVQLTNYGAAIVSVKMPDREGPHGRRGAGIQTPRRLLLRRSRLGKKAWDAAPTASLSDA